MFRKVSGLIVLTGIGFALSLLGCSQSGSPTQPEESAAETRTVSTVSPPTATGAADQSAPNGEEHGHKAGEHGGIIVSLGRDSYHVEAIVTREGQLRLYTLGNDESRIQEVEIQPMTAYVKADGATDSVTLEVKAEPQPGDSKGKSSLFMAQLPDELLGKTLDVTVPNIRIAGERFRMGFTTRAAEHSEEAMPDKVANEEEVQLYLTAGGAYTEDDIKANGNQTASQKFKGFMSAHDMKPEVGDKICPVTMTKANPKCSWIVGGKTYEFCCPPCVDEFVKLAKENPDDVKSPDDYYKR